jgi:hypothetical protein
MCVGENGVTCEQEFHGPRFLGMTGDVQRALILVAQIFTNKFDMGDNLRNSVVFPTTSLYAAWETNDVRSVTSRNTGIERSKVFVQMFVRSCGQWTEPLTTRVNNNAIAKGTTDDNVDTHRKMRHTQRQ